MAPKNVILAALAALIFPAVCLQAQTRSLIYNATNGEVITATNVVWTNSFSFSTNTVAASVRANLGLGATWLTNTNVTNFRTAIGLGATNNVEFNELRLGNSGQMHIRGAAGNISFYNGIESENVLLIPADTDPVEINSQWNNAGVRTNLGLPLAALTNTSNVTMMRALSGSTNTNHPFSGTVDIIDGNMDSHNVTISNGIIVNWQAP